MEWAGRRRWLVNLRLYQWLRVYLETKCGHLREMPKSEYQMGMSTPVNGSLH